MRLVENSKLQFCAGLIEEVRTEYRKKGKMFRKMGKNVNSFLLM